MRGNTGSPRLLPLRLFHSEKLRMSLFFVFVFGKISVQNSSAIFNAMNRTEAASLHLGHCTEPACTHIQNKRSAIPSESLWKKKKKRTSLNGKQTSNTCNSIGTFLCVRGGRGLVTVQHKTVSYGSSLWTSGFYRVPWKSQTKCNTKEPHHHSFAQVPAVYTPPLKSRNKLSTWQTMV